MENLSNMPSKVREIKISYSHEVKPMQLPQIRSSKDSYEILIETWDKDKIEYVEEFKILLLNRNNRVLGFCEISVGGQSGTIADAKVIFGCALKGNAASIILAHSHPSGNINPSECDMLLTKKLSAAGKLLDISVLDHIIVTPENYYSFADNGML